MKASRQFKNTLVLLAALLVAVLAMVWFTRTFERVTREIEVGHSGEARRNPFLAAERFLTALQVDTESIENLHSQTELPAGNGTLFIPVWRSTFTHHRNQQLRAWVEAGGHLVVLGRLGHEQKGSVRRDELLAPLGVEIDVPDDDADNEDVDVATAEYADSSDEVPLDELYAEEPDGAELEIEESEQTTEWDANLGHFGCETSGASVSDLLIPGSDEPLRITYERGEIPWEMRDARGEAVWSVPGADKYRLLQYEVGEGVITALSGTAFMTNDYIGEQDNAELVWRLATWGERRGGAWIVTGHQIPGLLTLVTRHGWMVLWSAAALLSFWLWKRAWRFGPARPLPPPERRSVMEHVDASGRFLWRHGHGGALLADMQNAVQARAARRVADWRQMETADRHRHLAELSGLAEPQVREALAPTSPGSRTDFVDRLQRLDAINRAL
jgi:hypothetical protein